MKALIVLIALVSTSVFAQTTNFTLGAPYNNYIPVESQDGVATDGNPFNNYVYDCAVTTKVCNHPVQGALYITLPNDPIEGGQFNASCLGTMTVNTIPKYGSPTQQPNGVLQSTEVCVSEWGNNWVGTVTYIYASVKQKHCSSGHPVCVTAYYPVMIGGAGSLESKPQ